jgi:hypothetical protein
LILPLTVKHLWCGMLLLLAISVLGGSAFAADARPETKAEEQVACLKCHAAPGLERPAVSAKKSPLRRINADAFLSSVHGRYLKCTDCHDFHMGEAIPALSSAEAKQKVIDTCKKCHTQEARAYAESVHATSVAIGRPDAPACNDCHGEHEIARRKDAESRVSPAHVTETCSTCHENTTLQRQHSLPTARLETYRQSYHGIANRFGQLEAANCVSCHGAHGVKPSTDPTSLTHKAHLAETCGKCHPGASDNFAKGTIHLQPGPDQDQPVYWVATIYKAAIIALIGGFCAMILLDLLARFRESLRGSSSGGGS